MMRRGRRVHRRKMRKSFPVTNLPGRCDRRAGSYVHARRVRAVDELIAAPVAAHLTSPSGTSAVLQNARRSHDASARFLQRQSVSPSWRRSALPALPAMASGWRNEHGRHRIHAPDAVLGMSRRVVLRWSDRHAEPSRNAGGRQSMRLRTLHDATRSVNDEELYSIARCAGTEHLR